MEISGTASGWIAVGFSPTGLMPGSAPIGNDIMVVWVSDAGPCASGCVRDMHVSRREAPSLDAQQDLTIIAGEEADGITAVRFTRDLDTGDTSNNYVIDPSAGTLVLVAAHSSRDPADDGVLVNGDIHDLGLVSSTVVFRPASSNARLESMSVLSGLAASFVPSFSPDTLSYSAVRTAGESSVDMVFAAEDGGATAAVDGDSSGGTYSLTLDSAVNRFAVVVTAAAGNTLEYTLSIMLPNAELGWLSLGPAAPLAFSPTTVAYSTAVRAHVSQVTVEAGAADPSATVTINGLESTSEVVGLAVGPNTITVTVVSADTLSSTTYEVEVARAPPLPPGGWQYSRLLNAEYACTVSWNATDTDVLFEVSARVSGWIGLGISPTGRMRGSGSVGSDVWVMWVSTSGPCAGGCLSDASVRSQTAPSPDVSQDLVLLGGEQVDGSTTVRFSRPLSTGDLTGDYDLLPEMSMNLIFAGHASREPAEEGGALALADRHQFRGSQEITLQPFSGDVSLTSLEVESSGGVEEPLTPSFLPQFLRYSILRDDLMTEVTIAAVAGNPGASVEVRGDTEAPFGPFALVEDAEVFEIVVTAEDGFTSRTYMLTVALPNADLFDLSLSDDLVLSPDFSPLITSYSSVAPFTLEWVTVVPLPVDECATVLIDGVAGGTSYGLVPLSVGNNEIVVEVTSADCTATLTYTVTVERLSETAATTTATTGSTTTAASSTASSSASSSTTSSSSPGSSSGGTEGDGPVDSGVRAPPAVLLVVLCFLLAIH